MVRKLLVLPALEDLKKFQSLILAEVRQAAVKSDFDGMMLFISPDGEQFTVAGDYTDVEFKFEIFFPIIRRDIQLSYHETSLKAAFNEGCTIHCLMRAEWIRKKDSELPSSDSNLVQEMGRLVDVPANAGAVGYCLFGFGFVDKQGQTLALVVIDDQVSMGLRFVEGQDAMQSLMKTCDCIAPGILLNLSEIMSDWTTFHR